MPSARMCEEAKIAIQPMPNRPNATITFGTPLAGEIGTALHERVIGGGAATGASDVGQATRRFGLSACMEGGRCVIQLSLGTGSAEAARSIVDRCIIAPTTFRCPDVLASCTDRDGRGLLWVHHGLSYGLSPGVQNRFRHCQC